MIEQKNRIIFESSFSAIPEFVAMGNTIVIQRQNNELEIIKLLFDPNRDDFEAKQNVVKLPDDVKVRAAEESLQSHKYRLGQIMIEHK